jgi:AAA domain
MQLLGATVLAGGQWLGTWPEHGPALYLTAEEEDNEARLRLEAVAESLGSTRHKLKEAKLKVLSFAGRDAVLGEPDRHGFIRPTRLFERIREDALRLKPKLIGFDAAADVYAGDEINRAQTRQFVTLLRGLAMATDSAVMLIAHPSLQGITSGSGLSGSTAWHNSVRARMYFQKAPGDDKSLRVLQVKKNNYGPEQEDILLRWRDGVYEVVPGEGSLEKLTEDARVDDLFLKLLRQFTEQGRNVSGNDNSPNRAPKLFAADPDAKGTSKKQFAEAMARLFKAGRIKIVSQGRPSHQTFRLVESTQSAFQSAEVLLPRPTPQPTPGQLLPTPGQGEGVGGPPMTPPESAGADGARPSVPGPTDSGSSVGSPAGKSLATPSPDEEEVVIQRDTPDGIPFMITVAQKRRLRELGFAECDISAMTPAQAQDILNPKKRRHTRGLTFFGVEPFQPCAHCGERHGVIYHAQDPNHLDRPSVNLHEACVNAWLEAQKEQNK